MDREFDPKANDPQDKRQQAQSNLEDLKRIMSEIHTDEPENIPEAELPSQEEAVAEEHEPETEESKAKKQILVEKKELPKHAEEQPEQETVDAPEEETAPAADMPQEAPAGGEPEKKSAPEPERDVQADREQMQREAILNRQAKRLHSRQSAATVHPGDAGKKTAASPVAKKKKINKNSKERVARRRKKRMMRLGTVLVVLLLIIVLVVSAVRGISKRNTQSAGSDLKGTSQSQNTGEGNGAASQQESEQYKKIKDDTSLPSYALEYPGLYADAVSEPNQESDEKVCYLTFDDGPSSTNTPGILDALKEADVKATFFVVASEIDGCEDILQRIVDEGHTLCIHANEHVYGTLYQSVDGYLEDFAEAYDKIYDLTGYRVQGFRFPGGSNNIVMARHDTYDAIVTEMTRRGFEYYDWNAYAHDAESGDHTVQDMVDYAISEVRSSSRNDVILLMHDNYDKEMSVQALPKIIEELRDAGIEMKPITAATRPVHFEVDESTPPELPEADEQSDSDAEA